MLPKELTEAKRIETAALSTYNQAKAFRERIEKKLNRVAPQEDSMDLAIQRQIERRDAKRLAKR